MLKSTQYIVVCTHNARVENDDRIEEKKPCGWILITHRKLNGTVYCYSLT